MGKTDLPANDAEDFGRMIYDSTGNTFCAAAGSGNCLHGRGVLREAGTARPWTLGSTPSRAIAQSVAPGGCPGRRLRHSFRQSDAGSGSGVRDGFAGGRGQGGRWFSSRSIHRRSGACCQAAFAFRFPRDQSGQWSLLVVITVPSEFPKKRNFKTRAEGYDRWLFTVTGDSIQ